ncbi:unnamed protein product [Dicrocoelium dendriticum]|nr:unnamed protein product [Dicrocoelium dendriticum]
MRALRRSIEQMTKQKHAKPTAKYLENQKQSFTNAKMFPFFSNYRAPLPRCDRTLRFSFLAHVDLSIP